MAFFRRVGKRFQASFLSLGMAFVAGIAGCDTGGGGGGQVTGLSVAQEMSVVSAGDGGATRGTGKGVSDFPPDAAYFTDPLHGERCGRRFKP